MMQDVKRKKLLVNLRKMQANTHLLVKEHELIDAKKRLEAALPMNPVLKKQKKLNELSQRIKIWG